MFSVFNHNPAVHNHIFNALGHETYGSGSPEYSGLSVTQEGATFEVEAHGRGTARVSHMIELGTKE